MGCRVYRIATSGSVWAFSKYNYVVHWRLGGYSLHLARLRTEGLEILGRQCADLGLHVGRFSDFGLKV